MVTAGSECVCWCWSGDRSRGKSEGGHSAGQSCHTGSLTAVVYCTADAIIEHGVCVGGGSTGMQLILRFCLSYINL